MPKNAQLVSVRDKIQRQLAHSPGQEGRTACLPVHSKAVASWPSPSSQHPLLCGGGISVRSKGYPPHCSLPSQ